MSKIDHFVSERQTLIFAQLQSKGRVLAQDLAQAFDVSEDTIRRDLRDMAARGLCERVYGGALISGGKTVPLSHRVTDMQDRKDVLGRAAAACISQGMTIFLDAGSTNLAIARHLPKGAELTVVTNTPVIAAELSDRADLELIVVGGRIDPAVGAAIDTVAISQLEDMRPDLCILGVCGMTADGGLSADIYQDAIFKRLACKASARTLAAITTEKLGTGAAFHVAPLTPDLTLVLEGDADDTFVRDLRRRNLDIHLAGRDARASSHPHSPKDQLA